MKYVKNIREKASYKAARGNVTENDNVDEYMRNMGRANRLQFARSSYMGLSNG